MGRTQNDGKALPSQEETTDTLLAGVGELQTVTGVTSAVTDKISLAPLMPCGLQEMCPPEI